MASNFFQRLYLFLSQGDLCRASGFSSIHALRRKGRGIPDMVVCYPSTPKRLAMTAGFFVSGAALFGYGLHLYYVNAAPQQARVKARREFVMERLQQRYGYESPYPQLKQKYGSESSDK